MTITETLDQMINTLETEGCLDYGKLPQRDQAHIRMAMRDDVYYGFQGSGYTIAFSDTGFAAYSPTGVEADFRRVFDQTLGALWELKWKYAQPGRLPAEGVIA